MARHRQHVRAGEWTLLAFLFLALLAAAQFVHSFSRSVSTDFWWATWPYLVRVGLFVALYYYARRRKARAFWAAAVVLAVLGLNVALVGDWLLGGSYVIGAYLEVRAARAARRLPRHEAEELPDVLDADWME